MAQSSFHIPDLFAQRVTISCELFPERDATKWDRFTAAVAKLAALDLDFFSVTSGAGGSTIGGTKQAVCHVQETHGVPAMAHMTCVHTNRSGIDTILDEYRDAGIANILALRGDLPKDWDPAARPADAFNHANELVSHLHQRGDFATAVAAFPEGHPDSAAAADDWHYLKENLPRVPVLRLPKRSLTPTITAISATGSINTMVTTVAWFPASLCLPPGPGHKTLPPSFVPIPACQKPCAKSLSHAATTKKPQPKQVINTPFSCAVNCSSKAHLGCIFTPSTKLLGRQDWCNSYEKMASLHLETLETK